MNELSNDGSNSELKAELQELRKRLEDLETKQAACKSGTDSTVRRRFPKRLIIASISLVALLVVSGLLWSDDVKALFIDEQGNVHIPGTLAVGKVVGLASQPLSLQADLLQFNDSEGKSKYHINLKTGFDLAETGFPANQLKMDSESGDVGIGTTPAADTKLDVNGAVNVRGLLGAKDGRFRELVTAKTLIVDENLNAGNLFEGKYFRIGAGQTRPGSTAWRQYGPDSIYVDVDTTAAGFTETPIYVTSLGGKMNHFVTIGATSVYDASKTGFRIYLKFAGSGNLTPLVANDPTNSWYIEWIGVQR